MGYSHQTSRSNNKSPQVFRCFSGSKSFPKKTIQYRMVADLFPASWQIFQWSNDPPIKGSSSRRMKTLRTTWRFCKRHLLYCRCTYQYYMYLNGNMVVNHNLELAKNPHPPRPRLGIQHLAVGVRNQSISRNGSGKWHSKCEPQDRTPGMTDGWKSLHHLLVNGIFPTCMYMNKYNIYIYTNKIKISSSAFGEFLVAIKCMTILWKHHDM